MTKTELQEWIIRDGRLLTKYGPWWVQAHAIEWDAVDGFVDWALAWLRGLHDARLVFSVHNEKPVDWFRKKGSSRIRITLQPNGTQVIRDGEMTYMLPAGAENPHTTVMFVPLRTYRSLEHNIGLIEQGVESFITCKGGNDARGA